MAAGDCEIMLNGTVVTIKASERVFERTLNMNGAVCYVPGQKRKCHTGSPVYVAGIIGRMQLTVISVSGDGLTWKGDDGVERFTSDILLP